MASTNNVLHTANAHIVSSHLESIPESDDELAHFAPATFCAKQADLIFSLREKGQNPPLGAFAMDDLVWTNHVTHGQGLHKTSMLAVILWDRLEDFIQGEQQHPHFPYKFTKGIVRVNLPHSLRTPCAHSPTFVLRFDLLPTLKLDPNSLLFILWLSSCDNNTISFNVYFITQWTFGRTLYLRINMVHQFHVLHLPDIALIEDIHATKSLECVVQCQEHACSA